jgi:TM2 domain-containing membrane protein YozV
VLSRLPFRIPLGGLPWAAIILLWLALDTRASGRTGIPEIDSLPLHDWEVPNPPLSSSKALAWSLLPGGAQFYGNHPVRGGFLVGLETILLGLGLSSYLSDLPKWNRDIQLYLDSAETSLKDGLSGKNPWSEAVARHSDWIGSARERAGLRMRQADLANSEIAWAIGLHFYGALDGQEIVKQSHGEDTAKRTVQTALWRGLVFPGGGQLYNGRYGKFGMLWMAIGAGALSAWSRQEVVEYLNEMVRLARMEKEAGYENLGTSQLTLEDLEKDRTLYRKRRNQYFWGLTFFYIYSVMDGMVDAALSDFDKPQRFALGLGTTPTSLALTWRF